MTEETADPPRKPRRLATAALALCLAGGAGAGTYFAVASGYLPAPSDPGAGATGPAIAAPAVSYVEIPPLSVPLVPGGATLRVAAQIEVAPSSAQSVQDAMPRILDAANAYLRAVDPALLEGSSAHVRVKGQLLRRVRLIAGEDAVHDLLLTEMVTI
ncbi:MAG: flagellar basal body-associated FliL family protein [Hasllibacter sp.]